MEVMDGRKLANTIIEDLKYKCNELKQNGINPKFAVILVGDDKASQIYIKNKSKASEQIGIKFEEYLLSKNIKQKELIDLIKKLNNDVLIHGILLQSPIPAHLDLNEAFRVIAPEKDIDGFNPQNIGKLSLNQDTFVPCTPYGVMKILEKYNINLKGKNVVIIGRSNIVGKPLIQCCLNKDATVTICHSKTKDIEKYTKEADVIMISVGEPEFLKQDMVKDGVVIIDIGINRNEEGKIVGDVDFKNVSKKASYITPVPGGVGPMTVAMLMNNVIKSASHSIK